MLVRVSAPEDFTRVGMPNVQSRQTGRDSYPRKDICKSIRKKFIDEQNSSDYQLGSRIPRILCLTTKAMAGQSITQVKVNQITRGLTTEEDLIRAFGPAATKTVCPPGQVTLDWFYASPISAQNYIPFFGPALGGAQVKAWELWVVLRANGTVKRYIAYKHYVNGETRRYVERSDYSIQNDKDVRASHF